MKTMTDNDVQVVGAFFTWDCARRARIALAGLRCEKALYMSNGGGTYGVYLIPVWGEHDAVRLAWEKIHSSSFLDHVFGRGRCECSFRIAGH